MIELCSFSMIMHLMPGVAKVVSISVGNSDQRLYSVNILLLHLCDAGAGCQQREPGQGLNIGISLQLKAETQVTTHSSMLSLLQQRGKQELTCMLKMLAILMAHRMPSRHKEATSGSSQSCSPTLKAASSGVHASFGAQESTQD